MGHIYKVYTIGYTIFTIYRSYNNTNYMPMGTYLQIYHSTRQTVGHTIF